jgi:hypothetical protein
MKSEEPRVGPILETRYTCKGCAYLYTEFYWTTEQGVQKAHACYHPNIQRPNKVWADMPVSPTLETPETCPVKSFTEMSNVCDI